MKIIKSAFEEIVRGTFQIAVARLLRVGFAAVMALAFLLIAPLPSSAYTLDTAASPSAINGLWWNPNESGWGTNFIQQYDVIFVTIYTYDAAGNPIWYVASDCAVSGDGCQGDLYAVTGGSSLTEPWNGDNKVVTAVGSITLAFTDVNTGSMNYTINGVNGSKAITRQVWRTSPATTQFPISSALSAIYQASYNVTLSAQCCANTYTIQYSQTPGAASTFQGQPASTVFQTATFSVNPPVGTGSTSSGLFYFNASPFENLGYIATNGRYTVYANQQALPIYATVGQGGPLDTSTTYTDSSKSVVYAVDTETWSLSSDTSTTAWACINDTDSVVGSALYVYTTCYKIDTTGNVLAVTIAMTINGTTLTFQ
ncbi:MAG: hypothetical protein WB870_13010 [Gallionellaceae bacterium]